MKLDLLAFGAHPDDVELSCSGTLLIEKWNNKRVGIIDLTKGELGTRGDAETREREASDAAAILGVDVRDNLNMDDGFFSNDRENQLKIISALRKYQPDIVLCNALKDRHPDHGRAAKLVEDAAFLAALRKVITYAEGMQQAAWKPEYVFHYIQDTYMKPDFVLDITAAFEKKIAAIKAFKTQFYNGETGPGDEPQTYVSSPEFLDSVVYRAKMFGKMIGVKYAEGFRSEKMIGVRSFDNLITKNI